jgi:hypothetical protein
MKWEKITNNVHSLKLNQGNYLYEAVIGKYEAAYDLTINFGLKTGNCFQCSAYCKTISQAKQLEARIRLTIMETYL